MKEKPIIFSTNLVKAILAGRKTQTRRVVKPQPVGDFVDYKNNLGYTASKGYFYAGFNNPESPCYYKCQYSKNQILWVRETFIDNYEWYRNNNGFIDMHENEYLYKANSGDLQIATDRNQKWKPSIYMPRKVARLFLKVKNIRIERIQNIKINDVEAEGINIGKYQSEDDFIDLQYGMIEFQELWDSINKKRGYGWDKNPYVFVIEFERIKK